MSSAVGFGCCSRKCVVATMNPGVQKPHCWASWSTNACITGVSASPSAKPSMVVIFFPCASIASTAQAYTVLPSINIVQAPQTPRSHTRFAPVRLKLSRKASSRVTRGSSCARSFLPFTVSSIGTLPGPWTATSSPAAFTTVGPTSSGTATPMPEIFMKSRRVTPEAGSGLRASSSFMAPPSLQSASITPARAAWHGRRMERQFDGTDLQKNGGSHGAAVKGDAGAFAELLLQSADVGNQVCDLRVGQFAFVGWHLAFAVSYCGRQVGIGHLLDIGATEVFGSHRCLAAAIGPMAHSALCLVGVRSALRRSHRGQRQCDNEAEQSNPLEQFHRHIFLFPHRSTPRGERDMYKSAAKRRRG